MNKSLLGLFLVIAAVALGTQWVQGAPPTDPQPLEVRNNHVLHQEPVPVLTWESKNDSLVVTLKNEGSAPLYFQTYGYSGMAINESINFKIVDEEGAYLAPRFFCGTGLEKKFVALAVGESVTRVFERPQMLGPNPVGPLLTIKLTTKGKELAVERVNTPATWQTAEAVEKCRG